MIRKTGILIFLLFHLSLWAQKSDDSNLQTLDTLEIKGYGRESNRQKIPKIIHIIKLSEAQLKTIESIDDLLQSIASVDIRTRGSKGVQSDISIRGGNFDQVLILLNGIPVNNPQTGHHHLDLPVDFNMLERIEIIEGATGQSLGANAYSGVINLVTKNPDKQQATALFKTGQYGYLKTAMDLSHSLKNISVYNGFSYSRSDGYLTADSINNTDFYSLKDFIHLQYKTPKFPVDLQAGYHQKEFGANSFYTAKYPWQYEKTHGYFATLSTHFGKKISLKPSVSYKLFYDEFQLFRESVYHYSNGYFIHELDTAQYAPEIYYPGHNYHKTANWSAGISVTAKSKAGEINMHAGWKNDRIWSNQLGENLTSPIVVNERIVYSRYDSRTYGEISINQVKKIKKVKIGGGVNILLSNDYDTQWDRGFFINYSHKHSAQYISITSASRLPSFTDLYYSGPENIGNPGLQPETAVTYETGTKWLYPNMQFSISTFYRDARHTIDWIKYAVDDPWQTQNLTRLKNWGVEGFFTRKFQEKFFEKISLSYAYLYIQKDDNQTFISKYVLDYLKHKLNIDLRHRFFFDSHLQWSGIYKNRNGQYLNYIDGEYRLFDYQDYFLTNLKWTKQTGKTRLGLSVENLFDIQYNDLSYVKMPGRWIIFELQYSIK